ncbi:MAG: signal peptidase II [Candidatus Promineifilaceae bacterium]|nr:signal peptidase II [Candidatus Promineifilaceae bacterium]
MNDSDLIKDVDTDVTSTHSDKNLSMERETKPSYRYERWILYIVASSVIVLDQWTKSLVRSNLDIYTYYAPIPALENFFRFTHVTNTGMAFGLFPNGSWLFTILAPLVSIAIIIYNQKLELGNRLMRLALGLQLGGALGNLIDRLTQGYVTDFMDFGPWPVWNLADLAVVSGTFLLLYVILQEERKANKANTASLDDQNQKSDQSETTN